MLERRRQLFGYELYIVEQWACSRAHPTFVVTTYTGVPEHSVFVGVLSVSTNEDTWSPRLRVYLKAVAKFHARKKETPLGMLMVTNLSGFPSALTVVLVPGGDIKKHREDFIVNEDMKRLGCSGRAGLTIAPPTGATQAKFNQLYRTSDRIPLYSAVIELVKLCQVALMLFSKLAPEYADGLLCDVTEQAINDWWTEIGYEYFNVEPSDGILGPSTVAALLGMLMGARNRLNAYGAPVGKDAFDLRNMKRGIAYFQKSQKLPKTRRIDRQTLDRLHRVTSKAANGEGWTMPKAVKSTVAELSGKGGEMVMGMVGSREKAGIAEVETLDIETFIQLASGQTSKWLWFGKTRKNNEGDLPNTLAGDDSMIFSGDDNGGYIWSSRKRDSMAEEARTNHIYLHQNHLSQTNLDSTDKEQALKKTMFKSVTGKMNDAKSGLGRIKDAVGMTGLRGHHTRNLKEGEFPLDSDSARRLYFQDAPSLNVRHDMPLSDPALEDPQSHSLNISHESPLLDTRIPSRYTQFNPVISPSRSTSVELSPDVDVDTTRNSTTLRHHFQESKNLDLTGVAEVLDKNLPKSRSNGPEQDPKILPHEWDSSIDTRKLIGQSLQPSLRSTQSLTQLPKTTDDAQNESRWPRHLSFSVIDDVVTAAGDEAFDTCEYGIVPTGFAERMSIESHLALRTRVMARRVQQLRLRDGPWAQRRVADIEDLEVQAGSDQEELDLKYHQKLEEHHALHEDTTSLINEEKTSLAEALKDIEVLGAKLEYEMSALQSKVEDVEDGVADFERQVSEIEVRAQELEDEESNEDSWFWWLFKFFSGAQST